MLELDQLWVEGRSRGFQLIVQLDQLVRHCRRREHAQLGHQQCDVRCGAPFSAVTLTAIATAIAIAATAAAAAAAAAAALTRWRKVGRWRFDLTDRPTRPTRPTIVSDFLFVRQRRRPTVCSPYCAGASTDTNCCGKSARRRRRRRRRRRDGRRQAMSGVDVVLVGAEAIVENGGIINKVCRQRRRATTNDDDV